ncbi:MAG: hypothetical protein HOP20_06060 [Sulfuriferula sp.]|nr:hypothetical protein [Sulfuriferula sp.]
MIKNWLVGALLVSVLSACNGLEPRSSVGGWTPPLMGAQADDLLNYYAAARKMSAGEMAKEHERARQQLAQNKTNSYRMRLVMLLMVPNTHFHDEVSAIALLNEVLRDGKANSGSVSALANLLLTELGEQQRLQDDCNVRLKDEQKRGDALQIKVDAIKDMEKSMIRRDKHL